MFNDNWVDQSHSQHTQPTFNNDGSDKLVALFEKFIDEDRVKTQSIAELSKAVLDLTNEVKKNERREIEFLIQVFTKKVCSTGMNTPF